MLLLDLTTTSHTAARTGIQRLARSLWRELDAQAAPICHDPHLGAWRPLQAWEIARLSARSAGQKRGAHWPWSARMGGRLRRRFGLLPPLTDGAAGLLVPEIFSAVTAAALPALFARVRGPRAAVFHDAIPLKLPGLTPAGTVARFPGYLLELLAFDGIAAISEDSRAALIDYWRWLGVRDTPPVTVIFPGVDPSPASAAADCKAQVPIILSVGTIEGRKNHLALLDACAELWSRGLRFELRLIGSIQAQTGRAAAEKIAALRRAGRPLRHETGLSDTDVAAAYRTCAFTVYPSLMEGFGLPVLESLAHGRPCVCSGRGATGESARGGGCVALDPVEPGALAGAIARLLQNPAELAALAAAARARTFKTWRDYAAELAAWLPTLPRRG